MAMHILIVALFLILGCHHGTGYAIKLPDTNPLQHLANTCDNSFLVDIIAKNGNNCKINTTVTSHADLECYMFFDINTQLCEAFQHSEFNLQEDYKSKMNETQNVVELCNNAKLWKFTTIQPTSAYSMLAKVLSDSVNCQKLCGVGDLLSDNANFYCTYFKWGTEVIHSQSQMVQTNNSNIAVSTGLSVLNASNNTIIATSTNKLNASVDSVKTEAHTMDTKLTKQDGSTKEMDRESVIKNLTTSSVNHTSAAEKSDVIIGVSHVNNVESGVEVDGVLDQPKEMISPQERPDNHNPEENEDDEEYENHDAEPEANNKNDNAGVESDLDIVFKGNNNPNLNIESGNVPQRVSDTFPNSMQDSFTDDDDHFFPIFLTGIIIVVLLYILYHNKNKFMKVILGLLVEGRQPGRRRNSRGHAYRRLDTLEQAMSSNTAAPPSKIIY